MTVLHGDTQDRTAIPEDKEGALVLANKKYREHMPQTRTEHRSDVDKIPRASRNWRQRRQLRGTHTTFNPSAKTLPMLYDTLQYLNACSFLEIRPSISCYAVRELETAVSGRDSDD